MFCTEAVLWQKERSFMKREFFVKIVVQAMIIKGHMDVNAMHKNTVHARKKNEKLLRKILRRNKNCEFGKAHGFAKIKSVEEYRKAVPLTTYQDYEASIKRMTDNNEKNIITSSKVIGYAQTSGSVGNRKYIPITQPDVNIYVKYTVTRMLALADDYSRKHFGKGIKPERGMYTGPAYDDFLPNGMVASNVADVASRQISFLFPYFVNMPFQRLFNVREIDYYYINSMLALANKNTLFLFSAFFKAVMDYIRYIERNWEQLADDIEHGTISELAHATPEIKAQIEGAIKPNPARAAEIRLECSKGFDETIMRRLWPNFSIISGIGTTTFSAYSKLARNYTKGVPYEYSIYGASEGLFAACDEAECEKQLLLVDSCFYEFIPVDDQDKIFSIDELEIGKEYIIIITNQAGLYRYSCGDVIKVIDYLNECPYVMFARRIGQLLNVFGEKTTEEHMNAAIEELQKAAGVEIVNWSVYVDIMVQPNHYVLLTENKAGVDMREYEEVAHEILSKVNPRYDYFVNDGRLGKVKIRNLEHGTNRAFMKMKIASGVPSTAVKPVRMLDTDEKKEYFMSRILD